MRSAFLSAYRCGTGRWQILGSGRDACGDADSPYRVELDAFRLDTWLAEKGCRCFFSSTIWK